MLCHGGLVNVQIVAGEHRLAAFGLPKKDGPGRFSVASYIAPKEDRLKPKAMMILIAGPYRSGTNDDPSLIKRNVQEMESYALPIFRSGHIPVLGEWLALPLVELAGSTQIGDHAFNEIFHPIATRLLGKCDAVLRVGGASAGADEMVRVGRSLGLKIYESLGEIPNVG